MLTLKNISTLALFFTLGYSQTLTAGTCYSSVFNCPLAPGYNFESPLLTTVATSTANGCFETVKTIRTTCKINDPVAAMFYVNGNIIAQTILVTPVKANANCTLNGVTIAHGQSVERYRSSTVYLPGICLSEMRTCNNGILSGSYTATYCIERCGTPTRPYACQ